jgi:hypothetical protein
MILLNNFTMLGTILSPAYLKCSAVSVHPSEVLPVEKMPKLNNNQSDLQFGFTRGLSPIMAALIVSEVILQAKLQKSNLYLVIVRPNPLFSSSSGRSLIYDLYR